LRNLGSPWLECLFLLHVIEIIISRAGLRDLGTFEQLAGNIVEALFASLIE
jgi:hypothetical protein